MWRDSAHSILSSARRSGSTAPPLQRAGSTTTSSMPAPVAHKRHRHSEGQPQAVSALSLRQPRRLVAALQEARRPRRVLLSVPAERSRVATHPRLPRLRLRAERPVQVLLQRAQSSSLSEEVPVRATRRVLPLWPVRVERSDPDSTRTRQLLRRLRLVGAVLAVRRRPQPSLRALAVPLLAVLLRVQAASRRRLPVARLQAATVRALRRRSSKVGRRQVELRRASSPCSARVEHSPQATASASPSSSLQAVLLPVATRLLRAVRLPRPRLRVAGSQVVTRRLLRPSSNWAAGQPAGLAPARAPLLEAVVRSLRELHQRHRSPSRSVVGARVARLLSPSSAPPQAVRSQVAGLQRSRRQAAQLPSSDTSTSARLMAVPTRLPRVGASSTEELLAGRIRRHRPLRSTTDRRRASGCLPRRT